MIDKLKATVAAVDTADVAYWFGVSLVGIGLGGFDWRYGATAAGVIIVYTVLRAIGKGA